MKILSAIACLVCATAATFAYAQTAPTSSASSIKITRASSTPPYPYIEIVDSCGPYYEGTCVNLRSGPGEQYPVILKLRTGIVLRVTEFVQTNGEEWYKVSAGDDLRYPERVRSDWYVSAEAAKLFYDVGDQYLTKKTPPTQKRIVVDLESERLSAYEGDTLFMTATISRGLDDTPTPPGEFSVYKKTPSRYMQGPIKGQSDQYYDVPGVPWDLYFTYGGAVIHGAYWHDHFGQPWSHGCINLSPADAKKLYDWADLGTTVIVNS